MQNVHAVKIELKYPTKLTLQLNIEQVYSTNSADCSY